MRETIHGGRKKGRRRDAPISHSIVFRRLLRNSVSVQKAEEYVAKLLTVSAAQAAFGFSESTFLRFRQRHRIQLLPGKRVHIDDVIAALDRERRHN